MFCDGISETKIKKTKKKLFDFDFIRFKKIFDGLENCFSIKDWNFLLESRKKIISKLIESIHFGSVSGDRNFYS